MGESLGTIIEKLRNVIEENIGDVERDISSDFDIIEEAIINKDEKIHKLESIHLELLPILERTENASLSEVREIKGKIEEHFEGDSTNAKS